MTPAEGGSSHCLATVSVPRTAHSVDFVLSDAPEGESTYDNRGGLDYHLPVEGSEVRKQDFCMTPPLHWVAATSHCKHPQGCAHSGGATQQ